MNDKIVKQNAAFEAMQIDVTSIMEAVGAKSTKKGNGTGKRKGPISESDAPSLLDQLNF